MDAASASQTFDVDAVAGAEGVARGCIFGGLDLGRPLLPASEARRGPKLRVASVGRAHCSALLTHSGASSPAAMTHGSARTPALTKVVCAHSRGAVQEYTFQGGGHPCMPLSTWRVLTAEVSASTVISTFWASRWARGAYPRNDN